MLSSAFITPKLKVALTFIYFSGLLVLAVFPFSSAGLQNINDVYVVNFRLDHLLHLLMLIPIYPILIWNIPSQSFYKAVLLLVASITIALLTEGVQHFLPYRAFNPADMIANLGGVIVGFLLIEAIRWKWRSSALMN